jgi:hypothetical protein
MNHPKLRGRKILPSADPLNFESFITRVELFIPRILTPGPGFHEPANMRDKSLGFNSPQTNQQTNKLGL